MPKFPVPAYKSKTHALGTYPAIILNNDSFTLSEVGLVVSPFIVFSLCAFAVPAIILSIDIPPNFL